MNAKPLHNRLRIMPDLHRAQQGFVHGLVTAWGPFRKTRGGRFAEDTFLAAKAVVRGFRGEKISLRASALNACTKSMRRFMFFPYHRQHPTRARSSQ